MEVLPAIDLRDGKVVRLAQGDYNRQTMYSDDPAAVAREFISAGARWVHVVDLDAARSGRRTNAEAIAAICREAGAQVQLGGGIRDDASVEAAFALGVARVVIGSAALKDWAWMTSLASREGLAGKVALGLDARRGRLARHGWTEESDQTVAEVAARAKDLPLGAIVYTDIERDGMLTGPDIETTAKLIELTARPIIASGGVCAGEDIAACRRIGCAGVIVGRAYYEGKVDLTEACRIAGE
jgi:phosphoribosylformimino-5-aminoimidazole carboxamide ribotide isomerase